MKLEVLPDAEALAARAAAWIMDLAKAKSGKFTVALSGGSTPRALYQRLARENDFPWDRAQWFWGDERFVPPDDAQSNQRMAREAMLRRAPDANIHPVATVGLSPQDAATRYEQELQAYYGAHEIDPARPLFDVLLLGLGTDGHTASLFPGSAALGERRCWVRATENGRITLTYPVLASSAHTAFLVGGAEKRAILARLQSGDATLPAAHISGDVRVFADTAAAG